METESPTEKPRICCIDIDYKVIEFLRKEGMNIFDGSFGAKITKMPTESFRKLNSYSHTFPENMHEYDIFLMDLHKFKTANFDFNAYLSESHSGKQLSYLYSHYPEKLFDPRPFSSFILQTELEKIKEKRQLFISFSTPYIPVDYELIVERDGRKDMLQIDKQSMYSAFPFILLGERLTGVDVEIYDVNTELHSLLKKYQKDLKYNQTFLHPKVKTDEGAVNSPNFLPLIKNLQGDIVAFVQRVYSNIYIFLPQLEDKAKFLKEFFANVGPQIAPELFPNSVNFLWRNQEEYWLPNHSNIMAKKHDIELKYKEQIESIEKRIEKNKLEYAFLHDLISETGDKLSEAIIKFLHWIGFEEVLDNDKVSKNVVKEEDIQVNLPDKLLIIECKGLGGTSSDSDCNQISKIRYRRQKQRNKFDVYALYIVNHQRYLPPSERKNPPFSTHQIEDAESDERGLLTTWQLFNLYKDITAGIISKEEAQKTFFDFGYIEFKPSNLLFVYEITEVMKEGKVCIVDLDNIELKTNETIYVEKNGKFLKTTILSIKKDDNSVEIASKGEVGLMLSSKVASKSTIWKKNIS